MSDLAELERKQADAAKLAERLAGESDAGTILALTKELQARAEEIGRMAKAIELAVSPSGGGGQTVVVLTPEQRERIAAETGVGLEKVVLSDTADRVWARQMPSMEPRIVEKMAARQAAASRLARERRDQVDRIAAELEKLESPELKETIENLRAGAKAT